MLDYLKLDMKLGKKKRKISEKVYDVSACHDQFDLLKYMLKWNLMSPSTSLI